MSIAALMRDMSAAGAPLEAIIMAVEAIEARDAVIAAGKAKAAARKREERARNRDDRDMSKDMSDDSHATVTRQSQDTLPTPSLPSPQTPQLTHPHLPGKTNSARVRGNRLPDDFELPGDWLDWATHDRGWSRRDAEDEGEAFRDYWRAKAGKDGVKLDWPATWRNWCRNSRRTTARAPQRQPAVPL